MFLRINRISFYLREDVQLGFRQVELYSGSVNVALNSKVIVNYPEIGYDPQNMVDGKGDKVTLTKKMLRPTITLELDKFYEITRMILISPENLKNYYLHMTIGTPDGPYNATLPGDLPKIREYVPLKYVEKERVKHIINFQEFEKIVNDRKVEFKEVRGLPDFVSRGSATDEELFKIASFFITPAKVLSNVRPDVQKRICLAYPDYQFCNICSYNSDDSTCKEINSKFCKGNIATDPFCEKYAIHNKLYLDAKPYCGKLDNLLHTPLCRELFPKNSDCASNGCSVSKNLYEDACKNSTDPRCGCINHELLRKNREKALKDQLNLPLERTTKNIEDQIKVFERAGRTADADKLKQILPNVLDKIKEYYYFVAYGLTPVSSTCLIESCRDGKYPVTEKCGLTTFILATCFNTIDVTALLGGTIRFQGSNTQTCKQTINLGKCSTSDCPKGYKCIEGECRAGCMEGKCPPGYKCFNGYCTKGEEEKPNGRSWLIWVIIIFILILIFLIVLSF